MHFGQYPFDSHSCSIDVSTLGQSNYDVTLLPGGPGNPTYLSGSGVAQGSSVGEFVVTGVTTGTSFALFTGVSGAIEFSRNTKYFATNILLPDILLHISIYCGFWIDATNAQARVALCVISGLSFRYLMSYIVVKLPAVTYNIW
jgi:hypothetical protein